MQYRTFERIGVPVSTLGYGTMRLPVLDGDDTIAEGSLKQLHDKIAERPGADIYPCAMPVIDEVHGVELPLRDNYPPDFSGELTVECTDQDGNPASFALPVNLKVYPPKKETAETVSGETAGKEKMSLLVPALAGVCGLLLILLIAQGVVLRRRLRRMEEEKL